jgi:putative NIF3 family GTP cyclohydrolase 1 type 2
VITSMLQAHPYEEVAYDIYPLENKYASVGMGMIGVLEHSLDEKEFLALLRERFNTGCIKHSPLCGRKIKKVAVCGGAGSSLLGSAISGGADVFVSGDFKYHQFFDAGDRILIADIGHYESEQFTPLIFYDSLIKNFPKFAVQLSEVNTNPIKYF